MEPLIVLIPMEGESSGAFVRRAIETSGELLLLLPALEGQLKDRVEQQRFFEVLMEVRGRVRIASKRSSLIKAARVHGFRVLSSTAEMRFVLEGHPAAEEAMRVFSPHLWRQQLRSQLQTMGILSLPKLRIWVLILVSTGLFAFVLFRLLPSAEISVKPREDTLTHTVNIFLVQTGAIAQIPDRVRTMPLKPVRVHLTRTITFDRISKEFSGESAKVPMIVINTTKEPYSFRKGTRLTNQAGMVFRIQEAVLLAPGARVTVIAEADPLDLYGQIVGERGNVPAGRKWEFVGLPPAERALVYAENQVSASGGLTSSRTVLTKEDLVVARKHLENELLLTAKQIVDEERTLWNSQHADAQLEILYYDELTQIAFKDFVLPTEFVGQPVSSVPVEGTIVYTAYAYDTQAVLDLLIAELKSHVRAEKRLLPQSLTMNRLVAHVIDYADDLSWIKITVDLSGTEQYVLDPLTPTGAQFAKKVREKVAGLPVEEAARIVKNFPEVDQVEISVWPPWSPKLPPIPTHIYIEPVSGSTL
ncbi:MAG TPA: hypothetical protein DEB30_02340 [Candidatus Peribacter riflensis]|uniref:Baseplate protein J-like domain-containing protein n=1 Tax=Candidatus Peribacter riflensis TaxID=1735162 RepID=A0A0S1SRQ5_9BACT|nr:MAG: hypothetical protein PeribacterA2_0470 [Candidatus Peribacter riflensis]OGJ79278.1 MAG: hypothetical protein A2398_00485 [Candidatus Peribacteria bacterium RIFOXYB1_FULL_57_12]ALM10955.1 MAG: hypothetical protein PeribacterB2_0469 [Candidatus Peribacter riflensis]ALM12058.1 MAG: hypothetical protein PeribacterC2_0469 [Candidatus Peribacter riflensis]ALM13161.1 MAG: hypothetical protein PeribacterD1_0470 [Candidatus Peribacter riflensis]